MNKTVLLSLVAGLLGGMLTRYVAPTTALAQTQAPFAKEIRAQSFTLVDEARQPAGTFSVERVPGPQSRTRIVLRDSKGVELWSAGGDALRPISEK